MTDKRITVREYQDESAPPLSEPEATGELLGIEKPVPVKCRADDSDAAAHTLEPTS